MKFVIPNSCKPIPKMQLSLFDSNEEVEPCVGCTQGDNKKHSGIYCKIMDWKKKKTVRFIDITEGK